MTRFTATTGEPRHGAGPNGSFLGRTLGAKAARGGGPGQEPRFRAARPRAARHGHAGRRLAGANGADANASAPSGPPNERPVRAAVGHQPRS